VGNGDDMFELDPIESIKRIVRKKIELSELCMGEPMEDNGQRYIVLMEEIKRFMVNTIF
jgi:hypothetical protein